MAGDLKARDAVGLPQGAEAGYPSAREARPTTYRQDQDLFRLQN